MVHVRKIFLFNITMPAVLPFLRVFFYFFAGSSKNRSSEFNLLTTFMRIFFLIRCKFIIPSHYSTQLVGSSASSVRSFSEVFSRLVSVCNRKKSSMYTYSVQNRNICTFVSRKLCLLFDLCCLIMLYELQFCLLINFYYAHFTQ